MFGGNSSNFYRQKLLIPIDINALRVLEQKPIPTKYQYILDIGTYQYLPKAENYQYLPEPIPTKYRNLRIPTKSRILPIPTKNQYLPKTGI